VLIHSSSVQGARIFDRESLRGLSGIGVIMEPVSDLINSTGLTEAELRSDVEMRLRDAGIRVLAGGELADVLGYPLLDINVHAGPTIGEAELSSFSVALELHQIVTLKRLAPSDAFAVTWSVRSTGCADMSGLAGLGTCVQRHLDEFINEWGSVNGVPKE
jgi:hypothetical protein